MSDWVRTVYWDLREQGEDPLVALKWAILIGAEKERQDFIDDVTADLDRLDVLTLDGAI